MEKKCFISGCIFLTYTYKTAINKTMTCKNNFGVIIKSKFFLLLNVKLFMENKKRR